MASDTGSGSGGERDDGGGHGLLSPLQRKVVAYAITTASAVAFFWILALVFRELQALVTTFSNVIWPLAIAGILALLLRPVVELIEGRSGLSRVRSIALLYALVVVAFVGVLSIVVPLLLVQLMELVDFLVETDFKLRFAQLKDRVPESLSVLIENALADQGLQEYLAGILQGLKQLVVLSLPAIKGTGEWFLRLFGTAATAAIIPVYLFFFLETDADPTTDLEDELSFLNEELRRDILFLIREFANIMVAFFRGQLLIGLVMGLLLALGFSSVGLKFGLVLGLIIGFLNIIPYLGTILGLAVVLPIAFFQPDGGLGTLGLCAIVFGGVQVLEGYFLTPKIMGKQTGLHPLAVIIAIFFWGTALEGLIGMILAIPLTAFIIIAWRLLKRKYLDNFAPAPARAAASMETAVKSAKKKRATRKRAARKKADK